MLTKKPTVILRHKKENKNKCSLTGLEFRNDFIFLTYPSTQLPDLTGYLLLDLEGEELTEKDEHLGLFLIDGTWNYSSKMIKSVETKYLLPKRRLPANYMTAYPRKQTGCIEPMAGLASIEALYLAFLITKRQVNGLLDHYYWKQSFLEKNQLG